jgi:hypothetical protein
MELSHSDILALQRLVGNREVQRLLDGQPQAHGATFLEVTQAEFHALRREPERFGVSKRDTPSLEREIQRAPRRPLWRPPRRRTPIHQKYADRAVKLLETKSRTKLKKLLELVEKKGLNKGGRFEAVYSYYVASSNPRALRDKIRSVFRFVNPAELIKILQRTNPIASAAEEARRARRLRIAKMKGEWPEAKWALTMQRVKGNKGQSWLAEWVHKNYLYLKDASNIASAKLGILFPWPKTSELPTNVGDQKRIGDLRFLWQLNSRWTDAVKQLNDAQKWAAYEGKTKRFGPAHRRYTGLLASWKKLFEIAGKGRMATSWLSQIIKRQQKAASGSTLHE